MRVLARFGAWAGTALEVSILPLPAPIVPTYISVSVVVAMVTTVVSTKAKQQDKELRTVMYLSN